MPQRLFPMFGDMQSDIERKQRPQIAVSASSPIRPYHQILSTSKMAHIKYRYLFLLLSIALIWSGASAQRTTRKGLKVDKTLVIESTIADKDSTSLEMAKQVKIYGYDKTLNSNYESFFIQNNSEHHISELELTLKYFDTLGNCIHQRNIKLKTDLPQHSTRQLYTSAWDKQKTFYYVNTRKPRRVKATPYDVEISISHISTSD